LKVNECFFLNLEKSRKGVFSLNSSHNHLQHLGQLAREYDRKFRELKEFAQNVRPEDLIIQLELLSERTTDRFRAAQQALLAMLMESENPEQKQQIEAVMALSSCFDEIRILLQISLESTPQA